MRLSISRRHMFWASLGVLSFLATAAGQAAQMPITENAWQPELRLVSQDATGISLSYRMATFSIDPIEINGETMQEISIPGVIVPGQPGAPNLPGLGRFIALPQGATARLSIMASDSRTYTGLIVAPAPEIPDASDDSPLVYPVDAAIYERAALYPAVAARLSEPGRMRGVDYAMLGISPFQYNPVSRELIVYTALDLRIDFVGGNGHFGEDRLRSRYWEPVLRNHLLNYASLEPVDFSRPRGDRDSYEYVIITPDDPDFIAWGDSLKAWRQLQGITSVVYTTTDIGGTSAYQIWNWLRDIYATWDPAPAAFQILGDYPNTGDGRDVGVEAPIWAGYCVSDNMYADSGSPPDNLPDMFHGRITARDAAELEIMIGKMLSYEREPYTDPAVYEHPVVAGGWQTDRWFILCAETFYGFQANILGKDPIREYAICSGYPGSVWSTNINTNMVVNYFGPNGLGYIPATPSHLTDWGGDAWRLIDDFNAGTYLILHRDHGLEYSWGEPNLGTGHLYYITNDVFPFIFSINCLTGKYNHPYPCFTEAYHRSEHGALGLIAASEVSSSFVNDAFIWGVFDGLWPVFDPGYPTAGENLGAPDLRTAVAMASGKYYLAASNWPSNPDSKPRTYNLFHHHGGAFMQLYSEVPESLSVAHAAMCPLQTSSFAVQANAGSVIALTVDGEIIGVADATGAEQQIPIVPQATPGTLRITVTQANHYRYDVSIPIDNDQAVDDGYAAEAPGIRLSPISPALRTAGTQIDFTLPGSGMVSAHLGLYDAGGRLIRTLIDGAYPAGDGSIAWDGRDTQGQAVKAGVYFCRLSTAGQGSTERLLVIR